MNHIASLSPVALLQLRLFKLYEAARPHLPKLLLAFVALAFLMSPTDSFAQASGGGFSMPWEGALQSMAAAISGPWVKWLAIIAIAIGGILFGIGELNGPFKYVLQIAAGFSVALGATALVGNLMGT